MDVVDADGMMISKTFTACNCNCANEKSETGDFECNICLDICKDPVVTLCGHLYCWPCLYQWLKVQFYSYECPVCKAIIEEEKLIPLYGRGKVNSNPRPQLCSDLHIPERPIGQRPPTAPPVQLPYFRQEEPAPTGFARWFAFLGVLSDIFRLPWNGMDDAVVYGGSTTRIPFMVPIPFNGVLVFGSIPFDAKNFFRDFSFLFLVILALLHIIY